MIALCLLNIVWIVDGIELHWPVDFSCGAQWSDLVCCFADKVITMPIREAARESLLFLPHAVRQMARPDRMITVAEVKSVVFEGEVIEEYAEDARGHSYLVLGTGMTGRRLHVVCSPKADYLAIITAYLPAKDEWDPECKVRRNQL